MVCIENAIARCHCWTSCGLSHPNLFSCMAFLKSSDGQRWQFSWHTCLTDHMLLYAASRCCSYDNAKDDRWSHYMLPSPGQIGWLKIEVAGTRSWSTSRQPSRAGKRQSPCSSQNYLHKVLADCKQNNPTRLFWQNLLSAVLPIFELFLSMHSRLHYFAQKCVYFDPAFHHLSHLHLHAVARQTGRWSYWILKAPSTRGKMFPSSWCILQERRCCGPLVTQSTNAGH